MGRHNGEVRSHSGVTYGAALWDLVLAETGKVPDSHPAVRLATAAAEAAQPVVDALEACKLAADGLANVPKVLIQAVRNP